MLTKPLPVVNTSLYDIGKGVAKQLGFGLDFIDPFLKAFNTLVTLSDPGNIPSLAQPLVVDYGSFDLGSADPRDVNNFFLNQITPNITATKPAIKDQIKNSNASGAKEAYKYIYDSQTGLEGSDLGTLKLPAPAQKSPPPVLAKLALMVLFRSVSSPEKFTPMSRA